MYHFDNADGSVIDLRGDSTNTSVFPSTYTNGAGVMGPGQATIIPFSWNTTSWNTSGLPYTYTTTDPSSLKSALSTGCGAGIVSWDYSNWLITSY
jgi:hypothetical protein